jgi:S-adenosylmethionine-dependent methyltransferase
MTDAAIFDNAQDNWRAWQEAPWGRLRYAQAEANIAAHLPGHALRVLDVAGGNGADAIPLALRGHHVTLVDYSEQMLAGARERATAAGVTIETIQADATAMPVDEASFDLVLCHNLVQYVADPADLIGRLTRPLRAGGLLSLMSINRETEVLRLALREFDLAAAVSAVGTRTMFTQSFGTQVSLSTPEEMTEYLREHGLSLVEWYGVRTLCDYISDNDIKQDPKTFADLERLEMMIAAHPTYRRIARFYQLIARR